MLRGTVCLLFHCFWDIFRNSTEKFVWEGLMGTWGEIKGPVKIKGQAFVLLLTQLMAGGAVQRGRTSPWLEMGL